MNRIKVVTKYIHDVQYNARLKLVSIVTTVRQNGPYLVQAIWYVRKAKGTMI